MIITLGEAIETDQNIKQDDLDAFEQSVRALTNNNFQNRNVRYENVEFLHNDTILVKEDIKGLRTGDTVEVNYSHFNDGLVVVKEILGKEIKSKVSLFG